MLCDALSSRSDNMLVLNLVLNHHGEIGAAEDAIPSNSVSGQNQHESHEMCMMWEEGGLY
jgi:hypothetical protein